MAAVDLRTVAAFNPFIVSTDVQKTDAKTRKFIRSHVMLGKNRGKRRVNKQRPAERQQHDVHEPAAASVPADDDSRPAVPAKVGNEISLLRLAASVDPDLLRHFFEFANGSKAKLFPLEPCIAFDDHQRQWITPITYDPLFLHATIFASQAALGFGSSRDTHATTTAQHFGKTVKMLRLRLEQDDLAVTTSNTTLQVVVILAMSALLSGQEETARSHLTGVKRIVEIRGGFGSFGDAVKLLIEVLRCDIGLTLSTGLPPLFFHRPFSGPQMAQDAPSMTRKKTCAASDSPETLLPCLDASLSHIWGKLGDFCKRVNSASKTHRRLSEQVLLDNMASNVYPLLNMRFVCGSVSETCRLALLAFCSNAFLQWQGMNLNYKSLPSMYRQTLLGLGRSDDAVPPRVMLWLLMMGGIALFTGNEDRSWLLPWLRDTISDCALLGWEDARDCVKPFLWIDFVHDKRGELLYVAAMSSDDP